MATGGRDYDELAQRQEAELEKLREKQRRELLIDDNVEVRARHLVELNVLLARQDRDREYVYSGDVDEVDMRMHELSLERMVSEVSEQTMVLDQAVCRSLIEVQHAEELAHHDRIHPMGLDQERHDLIDRQIEEIFHIFSGSMEGWEERWRTIQEYRSARQMVTGHDMSGWDQRYGEVFNFTPPPTILDTQLEGGAVYQRVLHEMYPVDLDQRVMADRFQEERNTMADEEVFDILMSQEEEARYRSTHEVSLSLDAHGVPVGDYGNHLVGDVMEAGVRTRPTGSPTESRIAMNMRHRRERAVMHHEQEVERERYMGLIPPNVVQGQVLSLSLLMGRQDRERALHAAEIQLIERNRYWRQYIIPYTTDMQVEKCISCHRDGDMYIYPHWYCTVHGLDPERRHHDERIGNTAEGNDYLGGSRHQLAGEGGWITRLAYCHGVDPDQTIGSFIADISDVLFDREEWHEEPLDRENPFVAAILGLRDATGRDRDDLREDRWFAVLMKHAQDSMASATEGLCSCVGNQVLSYVCPICYADQVTITFVEPMTPSPDEHMFEGTLPPQEYDDMNRAEGRDDHGALISYAEGGVWQVAIPPEGDWQCVICMDDDRRSSVECPSNHVLHLECARQWTGQAKTCPVCRCLMRF